jgi:predicted ATP-grasp superfamily ATP-dependent carboligase
VGTVLAAGCGLRGLFGVDGILGADGFWPVEVNPRYTASVEVLERANGLQSLLWHQAGCEEGLADLPPPPTSGRLIGKACLFARRPVIFPAAGPWGASPAAFADLPHPGERIEPGRPILTFFVENARTPADCFTHLQEIAADLDPVLAN